MFIFDISSPLILLAILIATVLLIFLAQEIKRSAVAGVPLVAFLILIVVHVTQLLILPEGNAEAVTTLARCIMIDFLFIFISFFAYLWADELECKKKGKKSISDGLKLLWKQV